MFGWFKRKKAQIEPSLIKGLFALPDDQFAATIGEAFQRESPAGHAMAVVAYENLKIIVPAIKMANKNGKNYSTDEILLAAIKSLERKTDEISQRRFGWFVLGYGAWRLTRISESNSAYQPACEEVWVKLAQGGAYLRALLEHNVVWKEEEKVWYSDLKDERDGVRHVVNFLMPKMYRKSPQIVALAELYNFHISIV